MNSKTSALTLATISFSITVVSFQNCSRNTFEAVDPVAKTNVLSSESIFGENVDVDATVSHGGNGQIGNNASVPNWGSDWLNNNAQVPNTGNSQIPINSQVGSGNNGLPINANVTKNLTASVPVEFYCSTDNHKDQKRFVEIDTIYYVVADQNNNIVCDEKKNQYQEISTTKKFAISKECLEKLDMAKNYKVYLMHPGSSKTIGALYEPVSAPMYTMAHFNFRNGNFTSFGTMELLYDYNSLYTKSVTHDRCDEEASPLIVALGKKVEKINLTSRERGIDFDILGVNSDPMPHAPQRISWFKNRQHSFYFIALPDSRGEVTGINQLFGDNTQGPDGKTTTDGYAALAKYDSNLDNYITASDEIFTQLRLWHDTDRNGRSSPEELFTMEEMGVITIDLNYDPTYSESDRHGNKTKMKSVVKTVDGQLHLLFDLWFKL